MRISGLLRQDKIVLGLEPGEKDEVLKRFLSILEERGLIKNPAEVLERILERERLGSTALDQEIAVPHALTSCMEKTFLALAVLKKKINFGTDEPKPVSILLLLLGHKDKPGQQLRALAHICRFIKESEIVQKIRKAESVRDICKKIDEEERKVT